jgi:hypothetical protein
MMGCFHTLRSRRLLLALLVLPGFLIRAAVPPGFMPAVGQGAALTMAMCSGHAARSVVVDLDDGAAPADQETPSSKHHEAPCVFAATAGAAPLPLLAALAAVSTSQADVVSPVLTGPVIRQAIRANAPRAPPALA